ncbi:MAG: zinc ribbon domain-containing protein [Candidatus Methanomethylicaceae archaeon]
MIAGMDVGQKKIIIAYPSNSEIPIFEKVKRINDKSTSIYLAKLLKRKGIDKVAIENPESLRADAWIDPNVKKYRETMNIILFLEEFKKALENERMEAIPINPRETSNRCPKCNKKLEILNEDIHILHCPFCDLTLDKDEIASWNILNRGMRKIKVKE